MRYPKVNDIYYDIILKERVVILDVSKDHVRIAPEKEMTKIVDCKVEDEFTIMSHILTTVRYLDKNYFFNICIPLTDLVESLYGNE